MPSYSHTLLQAKNAQRHQARIARTHAPNGTIFSSLGDLLRKLEITGNVKICRMQ